MGRSSINITGKASVNDLEAGLMAQLSEVMDAIDINLSEVASVVFEDAKQTAAFIDKTGNLRASIAKRKSKFINGGYIIKASGRGKGSKGEAGKGFHAHLIEFGHVKVLWGKRTGERVAPRPFMRPALTKGWTHALQLFRQR